VKKYLSVATDVFGAIGRHLKQGNLKKMLKGPVCHGGFKRLA